MSLIRLKKNEKILKVNRTDLNVANIRKIFKLSSSSDIYLVEENEGEVVLPLQNGEFDCLAVTNVYLVEGETTSAPAPPSTASLSTAAASGRNSKNPPPFVRPTFTFNKGAKDKSWKKSILVCEVKENGDVNKLFQTVLSLTDENSTVPKVGELLKQQLSFDVTLLDSKLLKIVDNDATKGKSLVR